eukprot:Platyproteum_vivax@DN6005_c0_g1_i3.p1
MPQFWDFSRRERSFTICPNRQSPTAQDEYERTQKVELLRDYFCNLCYIHLWPCNAQGGRPPAEPFDRWCLELMASADLGMEACAENMPDPWLKNVKECFNSKGLRRGLLAEIPWRPKRVKQKSKGGMIDTSFDIAIARQWLQLFEQLLKPHKSKTIDLDGGEPEHLNAPEISPDAYLEMVAKLASLDEEEALVMHQQMSAVGHRTSANEAVDDFYDCSEYSTADIWLQKLDKMRLQIDNVEDQLRENNRQCLLDTLHHQLTDMKTLAAPLTTIVLTALVKRAEEIFKQPVQAGPAAGVEVAFGCIDDGLVNCCMEFKYLGESTFISGLHLSKLAALYVTRAREHLPNLNFPSECHRLNIQSAESCWHAARMLCNIQCNFKELVYCLLLRYNTLIKDSRAGAQVALVESVFDFLKCHLDVSVECFASPLNCYYSSFYSAFPDIETYFGSMGSFFDQTSLPTGSYALHPPFTEEVINATAVQIQRMLHKTDPHVPVSLVVFMPDWEDPPTPGLTLLESEAMASWLQLKTVVRLGLKSSVSGKQFLPKSLSAHRYYCGLKSMRVYLLQTAAGRRQYPIRPQFLKELQLAFLNVGADVDSEVCSISISPTINFQKKGSTSSNWTHSSSSNWTHSGSSNWTHSGSSNWTQVDSAGSQSFDNLQIPASPPPFRGSPKRGATHHLTGNQFPTNQNLFRSLTKYESPATDNNWRNSNDRPPKQSNLRPPDKSKSWRSSN